MNAEVKNELLATISKNSLIEAKCLPDYARVAWQVALLNGASDKQMEAVSEVSKACLLEPTITYRDWFHILWAGKSIIGDHFAYLIAEPLQALHIGSLGPALILAPTLHEAFERIEDWAQAVEPINTFIRLRRYEDGKWYAEGDYPLGGWVRSVFCISACKLVCELFRTATMSSQPLKLTINGPEPKCNGFNPPLKERLFPGDLTFDRSMRCGWRVKIPTEWVHKGLPHSDPCRYQEMLRTYENIKDLTSGPFTTTKAVEAMQYTSMGLLNTDQVADRLHISRKVLERRLRDEGTTPKAVQEEIAYVRIQEFYKAGFGNSHISQKLGFVDSRAIDRIIAKFEK